MKKNKLKLHDLVVESNLHTLSHDEQNAVKGGFSSIRGRNTPQRTRWTSVDIRANMLPDQTVRAEGFNSLQD